MKEKEELATIITVALDAVQKGMMNYTISNAIMKQQIRPKGESDASLKIAEMKDFEVIDVEKFSSVAFIKMLLENRGEIYVDGIPVYELTVDFEFQKQIFLTIDPFYDCD